MGPTVRKSLIQLVNYFWVAGIGFLVDFGTLFIFTEYLRFPYLLSALIGFLAGLVCNFFLSEKFVFGKSQVNSPYLRFTIFGLIGLIGLGILELLMWIQVYYFHVQYLLSKIFATVAVYAWNFFARKLMYQK